MRGLMMNGNSIMFLSVQGLAFAGFLSSYLGVINDLLYTVFLIISIVILLAKNHKKIIMYVKTFKKRKK
jgi:hypothetical protein